MSYLFINNINVYLSIILTSTDNTELVAKTSKTKTSKTNASSYIIFINVKDNLVYNL